MMTTLLSCNDGILPSPALVLAGLDTGGDGLIDDDDNSTQFIFLSVFIIN